jgi:hypothetical protein
MAQVVSFAEESCWDGERFRSVRREIVFVVSGFAIVPGQSIRREFRADFGLWYDLEDEWLIEILTREIPEVDWGRFVFHKKLDHSAILIIDGEQLPGKTVGSIYPRGRTRQKLSGEIAGGNVVPIRKGYEYRAERLAREEARAERRRRATDPKAD